MDVFIDRWYHQSALMDLQSVSIKIESKLLYLGSQVARASPVANGRYILPPTPNPLTTSLPASTFASS
jgi:hypothetical protein